MASKIPYMAAPGLIGKILPKIQEARRPDRFTQDYLATKLKHSGGSAQAIIPLLKRLGFLNSDGTPTERYDKFRNEHTQGAAMAAGMREAFKDLFDRNEWASDMEKAKLQSLMIEVTGLEKDNRSLQLMMSTFSALKAFADFEATEDAAVPEVTVKPETVRNDEPVQTASQAAQSVGMNLAYTINLNLPETTDPEVFNAIFKALKENLLEN
ncbi:DUF5343 domain-containing protein [Terasakiella sp.]|uniref:DUF5343 domain-containing protein n=1 Tax=Terasakiella sp. TaxID=2034861 RepID=UPI003AA7F8AF